MKMNYSYRNSKFTDVMEKCVTYSSSLETDFDRSVFINELKNRIIGNSAKNNGTGSEINTSKPHIAKQGVDGNNAKLDDYWKKTRS